MSTGWGIFFGGVLMGISGVSNSSHLYASSDASRQQRVTQRLADMEAALLNSKSSDELRSDVLRLLKSMSRSFQATTGQKLKNVHQTMVQFSSFVDRVDPSLLEGHIEDFVKVKRKIKEPPNQPFLDGLRLVAPHFSVPVASLGPLSQVVVEETFDKDMGEPDSLVLDPELLSNPVPEMIHSFSQLVLWFTRELIYTYSGDLSKMLKAERLPSFGAMTPSLKLELEELIRQLLRSGTGIDDLNELKQIMSLVGLLGFDIDWDLLDLVKEAIREFIEENYGMMDMAAFVDFLQMVMAIVSPVLGTSVVDDMVLPETVRQQLDVGAPIMDSDDGNPVDLDGILPDGTEFDEEEQVVDAPMDDDDIDLSTHVVDIHRLQQGVDAKLRFSQNDMATMSDSDIGGTLDQRADSDSGDERGRESVILDLSRSLENSVMIGFESTAVKMLDVMNHVVISRIDPSLDQILEHLDLSGIDLSDFN